MAERDLLQLDLLVLSYRGDPQSFGAEEQRVDRQNKRRRRGGQLEMHFGIGAGEKLAGRIVHRNFDQQGTRRWVDRVGCAHQLSLKAAPGKLRQGQIGRQPWLRGLGVDLGHADVDAQLVGLHDVKQFSPDCRRCCRNRSRRQYRYCAP